MNKTRRKVLEVLSEKLDALKCELELLYEEEQQYYDNMSESLKNGDKGQAASLAAANLESAVGCLDDVINSIGEAAQ